jgi:hypothetical protein
MRGEPTRAQCFRFFRFRQSPASQYNPIEALVVHSPAFLFHQHL